MRHPWMCAGVLGVWFVASTSHGSPADIDRTAAWQSRGPGGGGALFSPSINPHDLDELFMASDTGGVFPFPRFRPPLEHAVVSDAPGGFNSQFRFTADPRIVYAINLVESPEGNHRTLVKSVDGGTTWTAPVTSPGTPGAAYFLYVDPHRTQRIIYTDATNVFFSRDGRPALCRRVRVELGRRRVRGRRVLARR